MKTYWPSIRRRLAALGRPRLGPRGSYEFARWLFLRLLALTYLIAFLSLLVQIDGLIGSHGILPAQARLDTIRQWVGRERYVLRPTLCWFSASDVMLHFLCIGGALLSLLAIVGVAQAPAFFLLWVFYLSLYSVCGPFLNLQWDALLLETGFLAIFFAPLQLLPRRPRAPPSRIVRWLLWWLLFRLLFLSGAVKWLSGDAAWHSLRALDYHYFTQPLPPWTAWYAAHLPRGFQTFSTACVFILELAAPLLIFGPRRLRLTAFWLLVGFQLLIAATGNYGFFNLLTIALCVLLVDDAAWPRKWLRSAPAAAVAATSTRQPWWWPNWVLAPLAIFLLLLTGTRFLDTLGYPTDWPLERSIESYTSGFGIANGYGLFAIMTTSRPEIIIEGSRDGRTWLPYEFKYKPGDPARRPSFCIPHMPRLDWQMWFCALGDADDPHNRWMEYFLYRLLQGSKPVLGLLEHNPFPDRPPKYIRAVLYDYRFTTPWERRVTGDWWRRRVIGLYAGPMVGDGE